MSNCKVIALTNQKGGVSLAQQGKKVLLIDADAQAKFPGFLQIGEAGSREGSSDRQKGCYKNVDI